MLRTGFYSGSCMLWMELDPRVPYGIGDPPLNCKRSRKKSQV